MNKRIRFRGGPFHNKSENFTNQQQYVFVAGAEHLSNDEIDWNDVQRRDFTVRYIKHKYQLGKDESGKEFYFYVGV